MSLKNLTSNHDLVQEETAPVGDMESQTGPAFPIVGPDVERGLSPFNIPAGSQLHGGPLVDQAGRSLVGPAYQGVYGGVSNPASLDMDGVTPNEFINNFGQGPSSQTSLFNLTSLYDKAGPFGEASNDTIGDFAETTPDQYTDNPPD